MKQEHLDADVVAGWADGSLDSHARAAAEAHAADCARCQAVLAAMIRTEPVAARPGRGWLGVRARWLVPLATAATAVALWVGLSRELIAPGTPPQVANRTESTPDAAANRAPATPAPARAAQPMESAQRQAEPGTATRKRAVPARPEPPATKAPQPQQEKPAAAAEAVIVDDVRRDALAGRPAPTPPVAAPVLAPPPAAAAPPKPEAVPPKPATAEPDTAARAEFRVLSESVQVGKLAAVADREFASPDLAARWRIGRGGVVQRSTDAGKTWVVQKSGVTLDLFAASAPSKDVCWIVGRSGLVLLTTDGKTWQRVPFPEPTDLRAVSATDARAAKATTLDGRVFQTFDGGTTWQR